MNKQPASSGLRDLSMTLGGRVGALLIALMYQGVLARALGPGGRGAYEASILFGSFIFLIFNAGAEMSSLYLISSKRVSNAAGVFNGLCYAKIISVIAIGAGLLLMSFRPEFLDNMYSKGTTRIFILGLLAASATLFSQTIMAITPALKMFKVYSIMMIFSRISLLIFVALFVFFMGLGVSGALYSVIITRMLVVVLSLVIYFRQADLRWERPRLEYLREMFSYGSRFYFGKLSNQINFRIGPLILLLFATREELGFYGQALAIAFQFMILPDALYMVLLPRASEDDGGKAAVITQAARIILGYSVLAIVGTYIFADTFFRLVLSEAFLPSSPLFKILILGFSLRAVGKTYEPYLIGTDKPGLVSIAVAAGVVVNLMLIFLLMPAIGLEGAAWALVGNYGVSTIIIMASFRFSSGIGLWRALRPTADDFRLGRSMFRKLFAGRP